MVVVCQRETAAKQRFAQVWYALAAKSAWSARFTMRRAFRPVRGLRTPLAERTAREDILCCRNFSQISSAFSIEYAMTDEDEGELQSELARLQQEHRDLDAAIDALHQSPAPDLLRLQRLKKRKLQLRDRIAFIEDQITPDIIA
jgi:hypothetical protein